MVRPIEWVSTSNKATDVIAAAVSAPQRHGVVNCADDQAFGELMTTGLSDPSRYRFLLKNYISFCTVMLHLRG